MGKSEADAAARVFEDAPAVSAERSCSNKDRSELQRILGEGRKSDLKSPVRGVVIGRLLGLVQDGRVPLVALPGQTLQPGVRARSVIDLYGKHVGCEVVLLFEDGAMTEPIVIGVLRDSECARPSGRGTLELSVDGERMIISAAAELVLRCGKSRLTLRSDGRIEVIGETVVTRATGTNRIQGGSIQLN